ncbi:MAG: ABC transporter ATP-binding protein [Clostridiales bacterium]|nr:ABC transporter ATP-binding protein [Clostridiales bacterium]
MREQFQYRIKMLKKIGSFLAGKRQYAILLFVLQICLSVIEMMKPLLYKGFIDDVIGKKNNVLLPYLLGGYLILLALEMCAQWLKVNSHNQVLFHLLKKMKIAIWRHYEEDTQINATDCSESNDRFAKSPSNQKIILEEDVEKVGTLAYEQSIQYAVSILLILYTSVMMIFVKWSMALLAFISIPLTLFIAFCIGKKEKVLNEENRKNDTNMNAWLHESIDNWKDYRLWGIQKRQKMEYETFQVKFAAYNKRWINYWVARILVIPELKNEFLMKLVVYLVGGYLISARELTIGQLLVFMVYYTYFTQAVQEVANKNAELLENAPYMDRVFEQIKKNNNLRNVKSFHSIERIEMQEVSFGYQSKEILNHWNLQLKKGDMVALDGESGRGKSTCVKLLLKLLHPTSGKILVNGIPLEEITIEDYYQRVSCVMQESMLFDGTIRENLRYAKPEAKEEELLACCEIAGIAKVITSWKDGLDTVIGEKGIKLSGGERQRIAIARALLKDFDVLILDEATSALDTKCEYEVWKKIRVARKDKIIIVITHRDTVKQLCNRVIAVG